MEHKEASPQQRIVAEADSWFDYPVGLDILDHRKRDYGYGNFKVAEAGDTLENMVNGYWEQLLQKDASYRSHVESYQTIPARGFPLFGWRERHRWIRTCVLPQPQELHPSGAPRGLRPVSAFDGSTNGVHDGS